VAITYPVEPTFLEVGFFFGMKKSPPTTQLSSAARGKNDSKNRVPGHAPDDGDATVLFPRSTLTPPTSA
jgi:hypothetical protein